MAHEEPSVQPPSTRPLSYGVFLPPFDEFAEPRRLVALAQSAERAGWDGFFLWDHMLTIPGMAVGDSFVMTAAIAQATDRVRLGMLVTPLARRRPWVLARQAATLDQLSGGRLVLGVGLGHDGWKEFSSFSGEIVDPVERASVLDDSLEDPQPPVVRRAGRVRGRADLGELHCVSSKTGPRPTAGLGRLQVAEPSSPRPRGASPGVLPYLRPGRAGDLWAA